MERAGNTIATAAARSRGTVTSIGGASRITSTRSEVTRAREARHELKPRQKRFAHLKRMYD
jgi:hypothetical protein